MYTDYMSPAPNYAHQVAVMVSKHYWRGSDGLLKYQKKPFEVKLNTLAKSKRDHMVMYGLRDHCSDLYYAEVSFGDELPTLEGFLGRAWREKSDYPFCGLPELLMLPENVSDIFPSAASTIEAESVRLALVTSGYQSGAPVLAKRIQLSIFPAMSSVLGRKGTLADIEKALRFGMDSNAKERLRGLPRTKLETWQTRVGEIRFPSPGFGRIP
jgi:hypothetical protein